MTSLYTLILISKQLDCFLRLPYPKASFSSHYNSSFYNCCRNVKHLTLFNNPPRTLLFFSPTRFYINVESCYKIASLKDQNCFWKKLSSSSSSSQQRLSLLSALVFLLPSFLPPWLINLTLSTLIIRRWRDNFNCHKLNDGGKIRPFTLYAFVWSWAPLVYMKLRQRIQCISFSCIRVATCVVRISLVGILPANNGACVQAEKRVWDVCMCRLIVRTAIESTYVGVFSH